MMIGKRRPKYAVYREVLSHENWYTGSKFSDTDCEVNETVGLTTRLDASKRFGLCIVLIYECHVRSVLLLRIIFSPPPVSNTVFTGTDTAPHRSTVAESL